jgi:ABC-type nitrate/sulfonate/bicarbonate transport system permease component
LRAYRDKKIGGYGAAPVRRRKMTTTTQRWTTSPLIFSSPSLVLRAGWTDGRAFADAFRTTVFETLVAMAIAWSVGVAFGALAGSVRMLARVSTPLLAAMIALPFVIICPVLTAWFCIGSESKIIFGVLLGIILGLATSFAANAVLSFIENRYGRWRAMQRELG